MPYCTCPACDKEIWVDNVDQACGIILNGCNSHSETKDFDDRYFFKIQEHEIEMPRQIFEGKWITKEMAYKIRKERYKTRDKIEKEQNQDYDNCDRDKDKY